MGAIDAACGSVVQELIDFNNGKQISVFDLEQLVLMFLAFLSVICPMIRDSYVATGEAAEFPIGDVPA